MAARFVINEISHLDESLEPRLVFDVEAVEGDSSCEPCEVQRCRVR